MEPISLASINKLVGRVQTPTFLYTPPGKTFEYGIEVAWARLHNRAGADKVLGLGVLFPDSIWKAGQWVDATTTFTDDTTDAQDADADDVALTTLTANDGHIVGAEVPWNVISYDLTTAQAGIPVYEVAYWNGSAWTVLGTNFIAPAFTPINTEIIVCAGVPFDWAKGGSGTGVPAGLYNLRIRATTAPTTAPLAKRLHVGRLYLLEEGVADNGALKFEPGSPQAAIRMPRQAKGLVALFSTADAGNLVEALVGSY